MPPDISKLPGAAVDVSLNTVAHISFLSSWYTRLSLPSPTWVLTSMREIKNMLNQSSKDNMVWENI